MLAELHPPLSGFPLALTTTIIVAELVGVMRKSDVAARAGHYLLFFLCIILIGTYYSGYFASEQASDVSPETRQAILTHQGFAQGALICFFVTLLLSHLRRHAQHGRALFAACYWVALLVAGGVAIYTGFLGGELVFSHGVGVRIPDLTP